ncbi:MAG: hypothetical protein R3264_11385, partial [Anaerolineae bacterium]|nr:hypothetical protein [Anaerolineae bacterium]
GGARFESFVKKSLLNRLMDCTCNQFSPNAYALSDESLQAFVEQIRQRKPVLLYGYASSIYHLARFVRQNNVDDIKFKSVFSSAEVLYPDQRALIEETFETKVFDRYATRELGEIGSQDESQTGLRLSVENVFVEILDDDGQPAPPGRPGQVVVTNLTNFGMPFIRYNLADVAAWHPENDKIVPGQRAHPMLSIVEGRNNDMFRTRDGRIVWGGVTNPLWNVAGVKQFQYIQKSFDLVVVKVVVDGSLPRPVQAEVERAIHTALGPEVSVRFEFPAEIPMGKSGKHRYQICEIDPATSPSLPQREPSL